MRKDHAAKKKVFISVGHNLSAKQDNVVTLIKDLLVQLNILTVVVERKAQAISDPVKTIRNIIKRTDGTIILAFGRYQIIDGFEYLRLAEPKPISNRTLPTVWNQIEGAMTLQTAHPLLILCEENMYFEGIIDPAIHPILTFNSQSITSELPEPMKDAFIEWGGWL